MEEKFAEYLKQTGADPDTIQQALRLHISERTDDLTPQQMRAQLEAAVASPEELALQLQDLERNSRLVEQLARTYFEHAWQDPAQRASIASAFEHSKGKLPVVETAMLTLALMYGFYLLATDGKTKEKFITRRGADGSEESLTEIEREPFAPIGALFSRLLKK